MTRKLLVLLALTLATPASSQSLKLPAETRAGTEEYVVLQPETDCKAVSYVAQSGVSPFPSQFLADPRVFILPVRGLPSGRYNFTAVGSLNDKHVRQAFVVVVGDAPPPPPPVPPGPVPPGPIPPGPAPIPLPGLRVLVVYESAETLSREQGSALSSQEMRGWLNRYCARGPDGKTAEWRVWDKDVNVANVAAHWREAMARPRKTLPWIVISRPEKGGGYEGPLPGNIQDMMTLLRKWGGE